MELRRWAVVGVLLALGAAAVVWGARPGTPPGDRSEEAAGTEPAVEPLVAPPGTRLVGGGGIVVAVPADWTTNEFRECGAPAARTVVVDPPPFGRDKCTPGWPTRPTLTIGDLEPVTHLLLDDVMQTPFDLGGLDAYRGRGDCPDTALCVRTRFPEYLVVPSRDVYFAVFGPRMQDLALSRILDSARPLPPGYAIVPRLVDRQLVDATGMVDRAGLLADVTRLRCPKWADCPSDVVEQSIPPGSVVPEGTTVAVRGY